MAGTGRTIMQVSAMRTNGLIGTFGLAMLGALALAFASTTGAFAQNPESSPPPDPTTQRQYDDYRGMQNAQKDLQDGVDALKSGDYESAELKFKAVLAYDPDNATVLYFMGITEIGLGDLAQAQGYLKEAVDVKRDYYEAREVLAMVSINIGDLAEAQIQLDDLWDLRDKCAANGCEDLETLTQMIAKVQTALRNAVR